MSGILGAPETAFGTTIRKLEEERRKAMIEEQMRPPPMPMPYVERIPKRMTKKRYLELAGIANELVNWLRGKGVLSYEGCTVQTLANTLWEMPDEAESEEDAKKPSP